MCGAAQIDGHTFCLGLKQLNLPNEEFAGSPGLIRSVAFLISQAIFRPKSAAWWSGRTSLETNTLAELIDMYHTHEATERHDKIFALLGMSSNDLTAAGLSPDYSVPWAKVFMNVLHFVFDKLFPIKVLGDGDLAIVKAKGHAMGKVCLVERNGSWNDKQEVEVAFWNETTKSRDRVRMTFWTSAKPILEGDLICIFEDILEPMILRACKDYFKIIKIAALPHEAHFESYWEYSEDGLFKNSGYTQWAECGKAIKLPLRDFLLVWDWGMIEKNFQHQEFKDLESKWCETQTGLAEKAERLSNVALILAESEDFVHAKERIQEVMDFCASTLRNCDSSTLRCMDALALMYKSTKNWEKAEAACIQAIQTRIRVQGVSHSNTLSSMKIFEDLASACKGGDRLRIEAIIELLKREEDDKFTEKDIIYFAGSLDEKAMSFLYETQGYEIKITENILKAAVSNTDGSKIALRFLKERAGECEITEGVVIAAAGNGHPSVMKYLLQNRGNEVKITEQVVIAAAGNMMINVMHLLLEERGEEVKITEAVVKATVENHFGRWIIGLLFRQRGEEITITQEILIAAARNDMDGDEIVRLLVEHRGYELRITPEVLNSAARSAKGHKTIRYLLDKRGDEVHITEEIVKVAVGNKDCGNEIIRLLLAERRDEVEVTEEVIRATRAISTDLSSTRGAELMSLLLDRLRDIVIIPKNVGQGSRIARKRIGYISRN